MCPRHFFDRGGQPQPVIPIFRPRKTYTHTHTHNNLRMLFFAPECICICHDWNTPYNSQKSPMIFLFFYVLSIAPFYTFPSILTVKFSQWIVCTPHLRSSLFSSFYQRNVSIFSHPDQIPWTTSRHRCQQMRKEKRHTVVRKFDSFHFITLSVALWNCKFFLTAFQFGCGFSRILSCPFKMMLRKFILFIAKKKFFNYVTCDVFF